MGQEEFEKILRFISDEKEKARLLGLEQINPWDHGFCRGIVEGLSKMSDFIRELEDEEEEDGGKKKISFSPRQLFSNHFDARDYLSIEMRDDDMAQRCEEYDISPGAVYELAKHFCVSLNIYDLPEKVELWVNLDD